MCSLPVCVTDDAEAVRDAASQIFSIYGELPSYRAMLDREGVEHPGEVAVVGSEAEVTAQIADLERAGTTDFAALEFGRSEGELARTREFLRSLA